MRTRNYPSLPGTVPAVPTIPPRLAFDQKEAAQLLGGISLRTLFSVRDKIGFSRVAGKIVFTREALERYLQATFTPPKVD